MRLRSLSGDSHAVWVDSGVPVSWVFALSEAGHEQGCSVQTGRVCSALHVGKLFWADFGGRKQGSVLDVPSDRTY